MFEAIDPIVFITVTASVVGIVVSTLSAIISNMITGRSALKLKKSETIFQEKMLAYSDFLKVSDSFSDTTDQEQITNFSNALSLALLFASDETSLLLNQYKQDCIKAIETKKQDNGKTFSLNAAKTKAALVSSMRKDLDRWQ